MDKMFTIQDHWEADGIYYVKTEYGELNTTDIKSYNNVIKDGFIIINIGDYNEEVK